MNQKLYKPVKFVLIGCGKAAHSYATTISSHPDMTLSAVVDENLEAAQAFGDSFRCDYYTSLQDYVSGNYFADCGIICTSESNHLETAEQLMQLGTDILYATPFAPDSASAEKMVDISRTFGVRLMMGSRFRYISDILHARELIQSGILGRILVFEIDFRDLAVIGRHRDSQKDRTNRGVLMDRGSHAIDIAQHFFGPLLRIRVEEAQRLRPHVVEDMVRIDMRTISGAIGMAQLSGKIKNPCEDYIRIYGTDGTLCIGWKSSMYRLDGSIDWVKFGEGYSTPKALNRQMESYLNAVSRDGMPEATAEDECECVRAMEAAYRSLPTGCWINLQLIPAELDMPRFKRNFTVLRPGMLLTSKTQPE
ncbi:MAG: Gfo/Idh/MocA family oxidoreductase [Acidobacteriota bacterium]